ncbi:MAG: hypothetical protein JXR51_00155 [Bacteroidales bacterium]|nr:hypothetical protein [Bacteroidales bacterium]MBN2755552.1 hypothetical protein [Bacteroidales bacterium]
MISTLLIVCKKEQNSEVLPQEYKIDSKVKFGINRANSSGLNLFKAELSLNPEAENVIISPLTINNPLKLLNNDLRENVYSFIISNNFNKNEVEMPFYYSPCNSGLHKMISNTDFINYYSDRNISSIEIPLKQHNYIIQIIISNSEKSINEIAREISISGIKKISENYRKKKMQVFFPKFHLKYVVKTSAEKFSETSNSNHAVIMRVDNSKAQNSLLFYKNKNSENSFIINRPFIFIIKENTSGAILFFGKICNPINYSVI